MLPPKPGAGGGSVVEGVLVDVVLVVVVLVVLVVVLVDDVVVLVVGTVEVLVVDALVVDVAAVVALEVAGVDDVSTVSALVTRSGVHAVSAGSGPRVTTSAAESHPIRPTRTASVCRLGSADTRQRRSNR